MPAVRAAGTAMWVGALGLLSLENLHFTGPEDGSRGHRNGPQKRKERKD